MIAGLALGLLLGMRHALDPDHLAAVSTFVDGRDRRGTAALGAFWGLGHSLALLAVGCGLAVFEARLPGAVASGFELLVAVTLVILGARAMLRARRLGATGPTAHHHHGLRAHAHAAPPRHVHVGPWTLAWQPLVVGTIHGLAGSGALAALAVASLPTLGTRLAYMALFGLGSIAGMALLTTVAGWQLGRVGRDARWSRGLALATGAVSMGVGATNAFTAVSALVAG